MSACPRNLQSRCDEAIAQYQAALGIFRKLNDRHGKGQTLANLGLLYEQQGQSEKARALWQEALAKLHPDSSEHRRVAGWLEG